MSSHPPRRRVRLSDLAKENNVKIPSGDFCGNPDVVLSDGEISIIGRDLHGAEIEIGRQGGEDRRPAPSGSLRDEIAAQIRELDAEIAAAAAAEVKVRLKHARDLFRASLDMLPDAAELQQKLEDLRHGQMTARVGALADLEGYGRVSFSGDLGSCIGYFSTGDRRIVMEFEPLSDRPRAFHMTDADPCPSP